MKKYLKKILVIGMILGFFALLVAAAGATYAYFYFSRDLPKFEGLNTYQLPAASLIYDRNAQLVGEVFDERRYPVDINRIPKHVRDAFLAAEDADFYKHPGIDFISILRAVYTNIKEHSARQGASTITQQVVKNMLLTREKKLERKVKEAILAFRIEKALTKDKILELYLNQIFFGNTAYGIQAAAKIYYHKNVEDLSIAEAAILAGLPKAPSRYSPVTNFTDAKRRQKYVLAQMQKVKSITAAQAASALNEEIKVYPATRQNIYAAPYYVTEVIRMVRAEFPNLDLARDGLEVHTALDLQAYNFAEVALQRGLREVDKRRGYRGAIDHLEDKAVFLQKYQSRISSQLQPDKLYPAVVIKSGANLLIDLGFYRTNIDLKSGWLKKFLSKDEKVSWPKAETLLKAGDVIEVSLINKEHNPEIFKRESGEVKTLPDATMQIDQTPLIQGSVSLLNPHNGEVLAVIGGYDYQGSQFNRATQALRQPGSAFKPIVYLTAVDAFGYTPSTLVRDEPRTFTIGDQVWSPGNYDQEYLGPITLRVALEKSRNLVSADIISRVGVDAVIRYAKRMGLTTPLGRNLSLSLGSSEVIPHELTRAYGILPAKGSLFKSIYIKNIKARDNSEIFSDQQNLISRATQVISEQSAFVMAYIMKGVVESGTATKVKELKRPAAGKTGTSNDLMDTWFIGFTPEWVAGVWVGFDEKKTIGDKETGGRVAAPIFVDLMKNFLNSQEQNRSQDLIQAAQAEASRLGIEYLEPKLPPPADFVPPPGVNGYWIDKASGHLSSANTAGAIFEYYLPKTGPVKPETEESVNYWEIE